MLLHLCAIRSSNTRLIAVQYSMISCISVRVSEVKSFRLSSTDYLRVTFTFNLLLRHFPFGKQTVEKKSALCVHCCFLTLFSSVIIVLDKHADITIVGVVVGRVLALPEKATAVACTCFQFLDSDFRTNQAFRSSRVGKLVSHDLCMWEGWDIEFTIGWPLYIVV